MHRRTFLATLGAASAAAQSRVDYPDYARVLPDFLRALARDAYARRSAALARLTTPAAIAERQAWVRRTFWNLAGGEPARTPLNARVTGGFERPAYRVENLIYESRPGLHIPANLYIPKTGRPPYPAVLFQMGHSGNGKAASLYQYCCQGLVQLGFLVLAFDPMGQGERTYYPRPGANLTRLPSADDEHTLPGKQLILTGDTSTRLQTWDAVRSLDYLAAHPLADPTRLASTGNSGGGTLTMLLAAADSRLACAAPVCPNSENLAAENFNPPGSTDDAEQNFIASGPEGFDRWDTLYPLAPKPLLVLVSGKDFFGTYSPRYIEDGRAEFARLRAVYEALGNPSNLAWHESPLPHGLSHDLRLAVYNWFRKHLQGIDTPLDTEPPIKAEPDDVLYASPTGNVVRDFHGLTPRALAQQNAAAITTPAPDPAAIRAALALDPAPAPKLTKYGETASQHALIHAVDVTSAPGVSVPIWDFRPRSASSGDLILLEPSGRNYSWNEDGLCQALAARGLHVIAPDLRAIGDLRPEYPRHAARHAAWHADEESYAWASLMLGKPLLGQRVADILAVRQALAPNGAQIAARGHMSIPALFAAYLDPAITRVKLHRGVASFRALLDTDDFPLSTANLLFGLLKITDLPQLRAALTARGATVTDINAWSAASF
ncbi:MAG: acetylxylan esterase [Bryobacteraceae bacterium]